MTSFAKLSPKAQELVVNALLGVYDLSGPPEMSPEVKAEITEWGNEVATDSTDDHQ